MTAVRWISSTVFVQCASRTLAALPPSAVVSCCLYRLPRANQPSIASHPAGVSSTVYTQQPISYCCMQSCHATHQYTVRDHLMG